MPWLFIINKPILFVTTSSNTAKEGRYAFGTSSEEALITRIWKGLYQSPFTKKEIGHCNLGVLFPRCPSYTSSNLGKGKTGNSPGRWRTPIAKCRLRKNNSGIKGSTFKYSRKYCL